MNTVSLSNDFQGGQNLEPGNHVMQSVHNTRTKKGAMRKSVNDGFIDSNLSSKIIKVTSSSVLQVKKRTRPTKHENQTIESVVEKDAEASVRKSRRLQQVEMLKDARNSAQGRSNKTYLNSDKKTSKNESNFSKSHKRKDNDFVSQNLHHLPTDKDRVNKENNIQFEEYFNIDKEGINFKQHSQADIYNSCDKRNKRVQQIKKKSLA